jgi:uncharacterized protein (TIGR03435 family)
MAEAEIDVLQGAVALDGAEEPGAGAVCPFVLKEGAMNRFAARKLALCTALLCVLTAPLLAQVPGGHEMSAPSHSAPVNASLEFDVATIKPSNPDQPGKQFMAKGHEFITINTTLNDLITFAYGVHLRQVAGGPAWMASEKFDLNGKPAGDSPPTDAQWKTMIQKLLQDRCKLAFHRESRELPVYALTVAKTGPKLAKSEAAPDSLPGMGFRGFGNMPVSNATMADFAAMMQAAVLDRPMIDRTGLQGRYDFVLRWTPDDSQFIGMRPPGTSLPGGDDPNAPPNLFTAVQEELGLKLTAIKAPVDVMVIDHVERPSAN